MNELKHFRDLYKNPDIYRQGLSREEKEEIVEYNKNNKNKKERDFLKENLGPTSSKYFESIELIRSAGLKPGVENEEEGKVINNRKDFISNYFFRVLEDIKKYLSQVSVLELQKKEMHDSLEQYQSATSTADSLRRSYHNTLISDIEILIRLININFNKDFPEDDRLEAESKMTDRKGLSVDKIRNLMSLRKYFSFPFKHGLFIDLSRAPKDPQGKREYIADWAFKMYSDLTLLSEKMLAQKKPSN